MFHFVLLLIISVTLISAFPVLWNKVFALNPFLTPVLKYILNFHRSEYLHNATLAHTYALRADRSQSVTKDIVNLLTSRIDISDDSKEVFLTPRASSEPLPDGKDDEVVGSMHDDPPSA